MTRVFVSIGSNVEPEHHVEYALQALRDRFGTIQVSPVYRTAAVGFDGDDFLNLVVAFETALDVEDVDALLDELEHHAGRDRHAERYAPRTLDLDLLLFGDMVRHDENIRVPRKELVKYAFMLKPLVDIAGAYRHPQDGRTFSDLLATTDFSGQRCEKLT